jgi:magnesium transporter
VAGVYGMNFDNIPELHWQWGYPAVWGVMVVMGLIMFLYMKSKKWF